MAWHGIGIALLEQISRAEQTLRPQTRALLSLLGKNNFPPHTSDLHRVRLPASSSLKAASLPRLRHRDQRHCPPVDQSGFAF